jgi:hypothetical protein
MQNNLTDLEIAKIETFNSDEVMVNAVRKVLLAGIYSHGVVEKGFEHNPLQNGAFSLVSLAPTNPIPDEIIGQQLRAQWAGINALQNAFDNLGKIKSKQEDVESPYNEAI